jgi:hypothetical protein
MVVAQHECAKPELRVPSKPVVEPNDGLPGGFQFLEALPEADAAV